MYLFILTKTKTFHYCITYRVHHFAEWWALCVAMEWRTVCFSIHRPFKIGTRFEGNRCKRSIQLFQLPHSTSVKDRRLTWMFIWFITCLYITFVTYSLASLDDPILIGFTIIISSWQRKGQIAERKQFSWIYLSQNIISAGVPNNLEVRGFFTYSCPCIYQG